MNRKLVLGFILVSLAFASLALATACKDNNVACAKDDECCSYLTGSKTGGCYEGYCVPVKEAIKFTETPCIKNWGEQGAQVIWTVATVQNKGYRVKIWCGDDIDEVLAKENNNPPDSHLEPYPYNGGKNDFKSNQKYWSSEICKDIDVDDMHVKMQVCVEYQGAQRCIDYPWEKNKVANPTENCGSYKSSCKVDGASCSANDECCSKKCVNGKCTSGAYCGDGSCNNNENCNSCPADCKCASGQVCTSNGVCATPKQVSCSRNGETVDLGQCFKQEKNKPYRCTSSGNMEKDCACGCPVGHCCYPGEEPCIPCRPKKCSDGTEYGKCSSNQPWYCDNGNLVEKCGVCGCPSGKSCTSSGQCATAVPACSVSFDYFDVGASSAFGGVAVKWRNKASGNVNSYVFYGTNYDSVRTEKSFKAGVFHGASGQAMQENVFEPYRGQMYFWKVKSCVTCSSQGQTAYQQCVSSDIKEFGLVFRAEEIQILSSFGEAGGANFGRAYLYIVSSTMPYLVQPFRLQ